MNLIQKKMSFEVILISFLWSKYIFQGIDFTKKLILQKKQMQIFSPRPYLFPISNQIDHP